MITLAKSTFENPSLLDLSELPEPRSLEGPCNELRKAISQSDNARSLCELQEYLNRLRPTLTTVPSLLVTRIREVVADRLGLFSPEKILTDLNIVNPPKGISSLIQKLQKQDPNILKDPALYGPNRVRAINILYKLCHSFGLVAFQRGYLEPFNLKFPDIPLHQAPKNIMKWSYDNMQEVSLNLIGLSSYPNLEELSFYGASDSVIEAIADLEQKTKDGITTLSLSSNNSNLVNLAEFPNLQVLNILNEETGTIRIQYFDDEL